MVHDPLSPGEAARTPLGIGLLGISLLTFVYSLVIVGQILVGFWSLVALGGAYLTYRTLAVADSFADAAQRYAAVREREAEADEADRASSPDGRGEMGASRTTSRLTEREE
ncbi:hypothetical protein [Halorubrum tibetense]|uniref:Zinc ribbon domain-containing protein n=1 Tax=Halorubrum tibetense TaxID=175631 RepID=A0ABD5SAE0_9EURY